MFEPNSARKNFALSAVASYALSRMIEMGQKFCVFEGDVNEYVNNTFEVAQSPAATAYFGQSLMLCPQTAIADESYGGNGQEVRLIGAYAVRVDQNGAPVGGENKPLLVAMLNVQAAVENPNVNNGDDFDAILSTNPETDDDEFREGIKALFRNYMSVAASEQEAAEVKVAA